MAEKSALMALRDALKTVKAPGADADIVATGAVSGLSLTEEGVARFSLDIGALDREAAENLLKKAEAAALSAPGVARISAVATRHREQGPPKAPAAGAGGHANPMGIKGRKPERDGLAQVKNVIAVASGKGGVGKSTLAVNLALALKRSGAKTGVLDADIYGPSLPTLLGLDEKPDVQDGVIQPLDAHGLKAISMGVLLPPGKAIAWRGPMVMGALRQLMNDVAWGDLDILIIDTPPGTGDVHLSLAQSGKVTGAIIISTPQEMALADVRRGIELFRKVDVPILGVIENMAWFESGDGERHYLFGQSGAERAALDMDAPFLGAIPIAPNLRAASDAGAPIEAASDVNIYFDELAAKILPDLILP